MFIRAHVYGGWKTICLTAVWIFSVDLSRSVDRWWKLPASLGSTHIHFINDRPCRCCTLCSSLGTFLCLVTAKKKKKKKRHEDFGKIKNKKMDRQDDSQLSIHFRQENGASRRGRVFSCALWSLKVFPPVAVLFFCPSVWKCFYLSVISSHHPPSDPRWEGQDAKILKLVA